MSMSPEGFEDRPVPVRPLDGDQARLLEILHAAGGKPVPFAELRSRGIDNPAVLCYELEIAGVPIAHVERPRRGAAPVPVGVQLDEEWFAAPPPPEEPLWRERVLGLRESLAAAAQTANDRSRTLGQRHAARRQAREPTNERPRERSVGGRADAAASRAHEAWRAESWRRRARPRCRVGRPCRPARASTRWRGAHARSSRGGGYRLGPPLGPPHPRRGARGRSRARDRDRARDRPGVELGAAPQLRGPRGRAEPCAPGGASRVHRELRRRPPFRTALRPERAKAPRAMPRGTRPAPKTPVGRRSCRPKATGCSPKATTPPPPPICAPRSPRVAARRRVARNRAPNPASPTPTRSTTSAARCRRRTNPGRRSRCSTNACTSTTSVRRCARSSTARVEQMHTAGPHPRSRRSRARAHGQNHPSGSSPHPNATPSPGGPEATGEQPQPPRANPAPSSEGRRPGILRLADARRRSRATEHERLIAIPA